MRHAGVVVIMPQCLAALGVDTFCPGTVRVTCVGATAHPLCRELPSRVRDLADREGDRLAK